MSTPTALYRLFGDGGALLYAGISNSFMRRWYQHSQQHEDWWTEVRTATLEFHETRDLAAAAEKAAIKAEHPRHNGTHNTAPAPRRQPARKPAPARVPVTVMKPWKPEPLMLEAEAAAFLGDTTDELAARRHAASCPRGWAWIQLPAAADDDGIRYDVADLRAYRDRRDAA